MRHVGDFELHLPFDPDNVISAIDNRRARNQRTRSRKATRNKEHDFSFVHEIVLSAIDNRRARDRHQQLRNCMT